MRITKHRKEILNLFEKDYDNLWSAESIYQELKHKNIDLSTIYRTLDMFFKEGLISKRMMDYTAYYYLNGKEHYHYMVCTSCHRKFKIECQFESIIQTVQNRNNFKATHHDITIYGHCINCDEV